MRLIHLLLTVLSRLSCCALIPMPDAALRAWANTQFPGCIVGTSIDETHPGVQSAYQVDISFVGTVTDLRGMEAFLNAEEMIVSNNPIAIWMGPPNLLMLGAVNCGITGTFHVPYHIHTLQISFNAITTLVIPSGSNLGALYAQHNQISSIVGNWDATFVDVSHNQLTSLWGIVNSSWLVTLNASHNLLTTMPAFNSGHMNALDLSWNQITGVVPVNGNNDLDVDLSHNAVDGVSGTVTAHSLNLSHNPLTQGIARLNNLVRSLRVSDTQLPCLPRLNTGLQTLYCTGSPISCLPNQPTGLNTSVANLGFTAVLCGNTSPCFQAPTAVDLRMLLQGPYDPVTQFMRTDLRTLGVLPTTDPYPGLGITYVGNGWPGVQDPAVLNATGVDAVVDWVVVELRSTIAPYPVVASRPALLQRDGDVVGTNGSLTVGFNAPAGNYRVAVLHRNHLGVMTGNAYSMGSTPAAVDLTVSSTATHGTNARNTVGTRTVMWPGDATRDGSVKYIGAANDRDAILVAVGGSTPNTVLSGVYDSRDVNLDGTVKYTGSANDRDIVLQTIGGSTPTAVRTAQLP